jgi:hypothetical protein
LAGERAVEDGIRIMGLWDYGSEDVGGGWWVVDGG